MSAHLYDPRLHRPILMRYIPMAKLTRQQSKFCMEGIGTFLFVTTVSLGLMNSGLIGKERVRNLAPIAIGFMLSVVIFCFAYNSGGHFNPAVTLGVTLCKGIRMEDAICYWLAQVAGGVAGGITGAALNGSTRRLPAPQIYRNETIYFFSAFMAEAFFTAALTSVVLHTACSPQRNSDMCATGAGFTIVAAVYAVGGVSGGSFNPAIATGLQLAKLLGGGYVVPIMQLWLYWAAPAVGAVFASFLFQMTHAAKPEREETWSGMAGQAGAPARTQ